MSCYRMIQQLCSGLTKEVHVLYAAFETISLRLLLKTGLLRLQRLLPVALDHDHAEE